MTTVRTNQQIARPVSNRASGDHRPQDASSDLDGRMYARAPRPSIFPTNNARRCAPPAAETK
ncbi:MAG: hypothetical protein ABL907_02205, partial [Hyphomicrobium sp.]